MFRKLINLFRPEALAADIQEELEFHRSQTVGSFGNLTNIQEQTREASVILWLDTLIQDTRLALRFLRRTPVSTLVALLSVTLSVGATAVVFTAVKAVLLNPLPYAHPERIVQLGSVEDRAEPSHADWIFWQDAQEIIRRTRTLASVGMYRNAVFDLGGAAGSPPQALYGLRVTANLFPTLGVSPLLGRNISFDEDQPGHPEEMILSYGLWTKRFQQDRGIVGQTVTVNGHRCLVIGVMPADFNFPLRRAATHTPAPYVEFWAPMKTGGPNTTTGGLGAVARLHPGISLQEAQQDLASISTALRREFPDSNRDRTLRLGLLQEREIGPARHALLFLMLAAWLFLLIGCANVANLLLARGLLRQREIALRLALGAGRVRLLRQFLTESCVLSTLGGVGGYLLSLVAWCVLPKIAPVSIPRLAEARADGTILIFAIAVAVVNGMVFALAPALRSVRSATPAALHTLGARAPGLARRDSMRAFFVAAEVAVSVVLVLLGGQLLGSFLALLQSDPGFAARRVLAAVVLPAPERYPTPQQRATVYQRFLEAIHAIPGVENAGIVDALPFSGENHGGSISTGAPGSGDRNGQSVAEIDVIGGNYLQAMGARLLAGRWFRPEEAQSASKTALVNDVVAQRFWPGQSAVGQRICLGCSPMNASDWRQVVGVVSTIRHAALEGPPPENVYLAADAFENAAFVVLRTERPLGEMDSALRRAIAGVDPNQPVLLSASLQTLVDDTIADRRFLVSLLSGTGALALLLAVAGVYGVTSYTTSRRTQEIGIRMALGATAGKVHRLVFRQAFLSVATGLLAGLCLASMLTLILRSRVAGFQTIRWTDTAVAAVLVLCSATVACWIPARYATTVDPMLALRQE